MALNLQHPYDLMLKSLVTVPCYEDYCKWLEELFLKSSEPCPYLAEIKALFEVNKNMHPLTKITSHIENEPEGFFETKSGLKGYIEVTYIDYMATNKTIDYLPEVYVSDPYKVKIIEGNLLKSVPSKIADKRSQHKR